MANLDRQDEGLQFCTTAEEAGVRFCDALGYMAKASRILTDLLAVRFRGAIVLQTS